MENRPGNALTAPFGNEQGSTVAGGGPSSGGHDFLTNPKSNAPSSGGRDFTRESRPQPGGGAQGYNPESVPAGGPLPFANTDPSGMVGPDGVALSPAQPSHKPFRLGGEAAPMAGEMPADEY